MHCDEFWTWTRERSILNKRDIYSKYSEAGEPYFLPWRWGIFIGHSLRYSCQSNKKIALESFFWWSWCLWSKFAAKSSWLPLLLNLNWNAFFVGLALFSTKTSWFARNQYGKTAIKCNLMKSDEKIKTFQIIPVACLGHSIENPTKKYLLYALNKKWLSTIAFQCKLLWTPSNATRKRTYFGKEHIWNFDCYLFVSINERAFFAIHSLGIVEEFLRLITKVLERGRRLSIALVWIFHIWDANCLLLRLFKWRMEFIPSLTEQLK